MTTSHTLNVHFWLKRTSIRKDGTFPIYARIWIDSKAIDISTKETILEKHWCSKTCRARIRTKNARYINDILDNINSGIKRSYRELRDEGRVITALAVKERYLGKDKAVLTCRDLIGYHKENEFKKLAAGTVKNYSATEKYLLRFIKKQFKSDDVYLAQIDYSFLVKFEHYLRTCRPLQKSRPLNNNGIMKHMERLQKFMTVAFKHGWVKAHPFALYELRFEEFDCPYLEQFELDAMAAIHLPNKSMCLVRDVFVFSCYTGLCYIEVRNLNKKDIVQGVDGDEWIKVRRQKSNTPVRLPLLDEAKAILDKYADYPSIENNYTLLRMFSDQKTNQYLKKIAKLCHIEKNLTFHVARHTFATTIALLNDVPIETVSKMLGHTKLSTTQKYARVIEKKISKDMMQLRSKLKDNSRKRIEGKDTTYSHLKIV
ncbi:site-specific integrase [Zobellia galactanivorans]|uniref:site-specific integrase n=1 Tax=Zobellia galactanivorans (strain DSM 12802 / CCUG 47099 / CIP 106680 / NCIMB 13871 / Dsij) TaxID=63186 RepID=UPI0026E462C3|nr:site-specific integrase [Zobellia galactanivorans]MDO6811124.1 site-specific integrase [Zobellia galactanivorans]